MKFFHTSGYAYKVGQVVVGRKNKGFFDGAEKIMELYRPKGKVSRLQCIYMVSDLRLIDAAGGDTTYVYEVKPIGSVTKADQCWMGRMWYQWYGDKYGDLKRINPKDEKWRELAEGYWGGKRDTESYQPTCLWEYLATKVKIIDAKV